jgi:nickel-type superoxide dismutase maturation protease
MFLLRRVEGGSMLPLLREGTIVIAWRPKKPLRSGDVVVVKHNGLEKIKRIADINVDKIYILGDNMPQSTDSRHFGWISAEAVQGKVIWPKTTLKKFPVKQKFPK